MGDTWFYRALSALGQGTTRLLESEDGAALPRRLRSATASPSHDCSCG